MKIVPRIILVLFVALAFASCENQARKEKENQINLLQDQIDNLKSTNTSLLDRMSDLSVINKTGAESIKQSLENINRQYSYIEDLTRKVQSKDSINLALVMNLKKSLTDINDEDISVEVRGGLVHVSISDKLLFKSGSSNISSRAEEVLGKIASVLNDHSELQVMVEGHTDDVPINNDCVIDNWDLSTDRANAVVRNLVKVHYVAPDRLTAAGRAEYLPISDNNTSTGRSLNRRTEIVIQPRLDQFFELLEATPLEN